MADSKFPKFKTNAEGEPIPPVDPEDIKRMYEYERTQSRVGANGCQWLQGLKAALSPEAEFSDVSSRCHMIDTLTVYKLLAPWQHGEELHEAVFRIAATFPFRYLKHKNYMIPGDEHFGFDPNAFVQRLVEETGISYVWEPVRTKIPEGGRCFVTESVKFEGQVPNPERDAKARPGKYCGRYGKGSHPAWTKWFLTATKNSLPTSSPLSSPTSCWTTLIWFAS